MRGGFDHPFSRSHTAGFERRFDSKEPLSHLRGHSSDIGEGSHHKQSHNGKWSRCSPRKRSRSEKQPTRIRMCDDIHFLNPEAIEKLVYLYPTKDSTLSKYPSFPCKERKSILLNDRFVENWLPMSLPSIDLR